MDRVISQEFFVQKELKEPKKGEVVGVWRKQPKDKVISLQKKKKRVEESFECRKQPKLSFQSLLT
jgi:hypothetical protein